MTIRYLFNIILKILGIFFIKDILATVPQILSLVGYIFKPGMFDQFIWTFISIILVLLVYGAVSYYLIFKSELIIDKLQLDKGFEEGAIQLNMHRSTILSISIIVIGGIIVADEIPNLCRLLFGYFQEKRMTQGQTTPAISYAVFAAVKIVIGLLLMGNQKDIVNYIENRRKK
jgi:hypothetical protein